MIEALEQFERAEEAMAKMKRFNEGRNERLEGEIGSTKQ